VLELTTDKYPSETSWNIKDSSGVEIYDGAGYSVKNKLYIINMCLETDEYTFTINDSYADGICCGYGSGGYKIKVNDEEVVSGGVFGSSETKNFSVTSSPVAPPSTAPHPPTPLQTTAPPTPFPTGVPPTPFPTGVPPTPFPTVAPPTPFPTAAPPTTAPTPCGAGATVLELTTDKYPSETSWNIKRSSGDEIYNGSGYSDKNTLHRIDMCLETDEYTFTIEDSYGDGICCSYGSGGYKIKVNGEEVKSGGEFRSSETVIFSVTSSPVAPPTTALVNSPNIYCSNFQTPWMYQRNIDCTTFNLDNKCNKDSIWKERKWCRFSCYQAGYGYSGDVCTYLC